MAGGLDKVENGGGSVLVVDDDVAVRVLLRTVLERMSFEVELAVDGDAALELLRRGSYALVLLDLMMPRVSGFDVLAAFPNPAGSSMPHVIVFTAAGQPGIDLIPSERVCATIRKPFDLATFVATVRECISHGHEAPSVHRD